MKRLTRWLDGTSAPLWIVIALCIGIVVVLFTVADPPPRPATSERVLAQRPVFASPCWTYRPVPSGCIFGIGQPNSIIESNFALEGNLIGGRVPVGDYDYMLGWGSQRRVRLPGGAWNHYSYYGATYVVGSGCVLEFGTPNGGRFAFLHMSATSYGCATTAPRGRTAAPAPTASESGVSGDERTAKVADDHLSITHRPTAVMLSGGHWVGYSRWPDWALYGNGSCCQADAHLCLVLDGLARDWFNRISDGRDTPPFSFPAAAWGEWIKSHHKPWITEWSRHRCRGKRTCLTWPASQWLTHRWLHGVKNTGRFYQPKGQVGYMRYGFRSGFLYCWPHYHTCKASTR